MQMNMLTYKDKIWVQIKQLEDNLNALYRPLGEKFSLGPVELRVLTELRSKQKLTMGELAKRIAITGTNLSPVCKKLERSGLIVRERNPDDERKVEVYISEEGWSILKKCEETIQERHKKLPQPNREDFENLLTSLANINRYIKELNSKC